MTGGQSGLDAFGETDRPEPAEEDVVCLVAVQPYTFERCADGFYPCPLGYDRTERAFDWMAFYRTAPTSAVTHYARVTDQFVDDGSWMGADRWEQLIGQFSDANEAMIFELGSLYRLSNPVENDLNGVRGAWYPTFGELSRADVLSELDVER